MFYIYLGFCILSAVIASTTDFDNLLQILGITQSYTDIKLINRLHFCIGCFILVGILLPGYIVGLIMEHTVVLCKTIICQLVY